MLGVHQDDKCTVAVRKYTVDMTWECHVTVYMYRLKFLTNLDPLMMFTLKFRLISGTFFRISLDPNIMSWVLLEFILRRFAANQSDELESIFWMASIIFGRNRILGAEKPSCVSSANVMLLWCPSLVQICNKPWSLLNLCYLIESSS